VLTKQQNIKEKKFESEKKKLKKRTKKTQKAVSIGGNVSYLSFSALFSLFGDLF